MSLLPASTTSNPSRRGTEVYHTNYFKTEQTAYLGNILVEVRPFKQRAFVMKRCKERKGKIMCTRSMVCALVILLQMQASGNRDVDVHPIGLVSHTHMHA